MQIPDDDDELREAIRAIMRGDEVLCEGTETRCFAVRSTPDNAESIHAIPIPADIKALCT